MGIVVGMKSGRRGEYDWKGVLVYMLETRCHHNAWILRECVGHATLSPLDAPPYPKVVPRTLQTTVPWRVVMNHAAPASDLFSATTSQPAPSAPHPVRGKLRSLASSSSPTPAPAAPPPPPPPPPPPLPSAALEVFHTLRPVTGSIVLSYLGAAASPLAISAPEAPPPRPEPTRRCAAVPAAAADASAAVIFFQICLPVAGSVTWTKGIGARGVGHGVES